MALGFEVRKVRDTQRTKHSSFDEVECRVLDEDYSGINAAFRYWIDTPDKEPQTLWLLSVSLGPGWTAPGRAVRQQQFTISTIRDLPLARWEQAARGVVTWAIDDLHEWGDPSIADKRAEFPGQVVLQVTPQNSRTPHRTDQVNELVSAVAPELDDDETPGGRRRRMSLRKLANVAIDYRNELVHGRPDPAVAIATKYGVSPSTARTWIHRARNAGLLAPAVGRTAGEGLKLFTQGSYYNKTPMKPVSDVDALTQDVQALTASAALLEEKLATLSMDRKDIEGRLKAAHEALMAARTARDQARAARDHAEGSD